MIYQQRKKMSTKNALVQYVDLFAGPGVYDGGIESTPLRVLRKTIDNNLLRKHVATFFNDKNREYVATLKQSVKSMGGIGSLSHIPCLSCVEVDDKLCARLQLDQDAPTLYFLDPFGYKGISLELLESCVKGFGCEFILFFNFNRVCPHIWNPLVIKHMKALLGDEQFELVRREWADSDPEANEYLILNSMYEALTTIGARFVLPFRFRNDEGTRTMSYIIHACKHDLGYDKMKDIMADLSSQKSQNVPSLEYCPADERYPRLFEYTRPFDELVQKLPERYAGETLTVRQIYDRDKCGRPYTLPNYKKAIRLLYERKKVECKRLLGKTIRKNNMPDDVIVSFPPIGS